MFILDLGYSAIIKKKISTEGLLTSFCLGLSAACHDICQRTEVASSHGVCIYPCSVIIYTPDTA